MPPPIAVTKDAVPNAPPAIDHEIPPIDAPRALRLLSRAPDDAPRVLVAWRALERCLAALSRRHAACAALHAAIAALPHDRVASLQSPATAPTSLFGRIGANYVWASLLQLEAVPHDEAAETLLALLAAELVATALNGKSPSAALLARVTGVVTRPASRTARAWAPEDRKGALARKIMTLDKAIADAPSVAASLGLKPMGRPATPPEGPNRLLNRAMVRRLANLREFAAVKQRRGVSGHGALDPASLTAVGRALRAAGEAGDPTALRDVLAILLGWTDDLIDQIPLDATPDADGVTPCVWLDVARSCIWSGVAWSIRDRARTTPSTQAAYLATTSTVRIDLPTWWSAALRSHPCLVAGARRTLGDLLPRPAQLRRRLDDVRTTAYAASTSRARQELVATLLASGASRYAVALALQAPYLVAVGRTSYGAVRQGRVSDVVHAAAEMFDAGPRSRNARVANRDSDGGEADWIGSRVVPAEVTLRAIDGVLARLAASSDATGLADSSSDGSNDGLHLERLVRQHQARAARVAYRLALDLALRDRVEYPIRRSDMVGDVIIVADKDVGHGPGAGVPVTEGLRASLQAWDAWITRLSNTLAPLAHGDAQRLRERIEAWRRDQDGPAIWTIDGAGRLVGAGTATWRSPLPAALAIVGNFSRHWWATALTEQGVPQLVLDALLRHQTAGVEAGGLAVTWPAHEIRARLAQAMAQAHARLGLPRLSGAEAT